MVANLDSADGVSFRELFYILRRWRNLVVSVVLAGVTLAILAGMQQPNYYAATALILVQPREERIVDFRDGSNVATVDAAMLETHVKVLLSRDLGLRVVDRLRLAEDPEFQRPMPAHGTVIQRVIAGLADLLPASVLDLIGLKGWPTMLPAREPVEDPTLSAERSTALAEFGKRLAVTQSGKSYVLAVSSWASTAVKAAQIANTTADAYLDMMREDKQVASIAANRWLGERLASLRDDYLSARTREQNFRMTNNIVMIGGGGEDINDRHLLQLQEELIKLQTDKAAAVAKLQKARSMKAQGVNLEGLSEIADSPLVQRLREEDIALNSQEANQRRDYGARHPQMIAFQALRDALRAKIAGEADRVLSNLQSTVDILTAQERALGEELARINSAKSQTGVQSVELAAIQQQTEASRRLYETFLQRYEETKQQADLITPDAKVVSRAAPPDSPNRVSLKFFAAVGFVASALGGGLAAVLADRSRSTARRSQDLEDVPEVFCFGLVAQLRRRQVRHGLLTHLAQHPRTFYAETMRSLATSLQVRGERLAKRIVAVTSALPKEGKSTVASSLSYTFARLGHRTLLIDLDLRRPNIGRICGVPVEYGLDDLLDGRVRLDDAIVHDVVEGLDVLPLAAMPGDPVGKLSSRPFRSLLSDLARRYGWVIVDCPPTLGLSDARLVAQAGAMVLFVVRWDQTPIKAVQIGIRDLKLFGAELAGCVITQVDLRKFRAFGLGTTDGEGYYRECTAYYEDI